MAISPTKTANWFENNHSHRGVEAEADNYSLCYDVLLELRKASNSEIDQNDFAVAAAYLYQNKQYCEALVRLSVEERKQFISSQIKNHRASQKKQEIRKTAANYRVNASSLEQELCILNNNNPILYCKDRTF
jgi:hypothetical protein